MAVFIRDVSLGEDIPYYVRKPTEGDPTAATLFTMPSADALRTPDAKPKIPTWVWIAGAALGGLSLGWLFFRLRRRTQRPALPPPTRRRRVPA